MLTKIIATLFTKGLVAMLNLLILLLAARSLGSAKVGEISLIILNISLVQLVCEIYTGSALVHFIPKMNLTRIYNGGLLWTVIAVLLLNMLFWALKIGQPQYALHGTVLSFLLSLHGFHMVLLLARQEIKMYNLLLFLQAFVLLLVLFLLVHKGEQREVSSYVTALYLAYSLVLMGSSFVLRKHLNTGLDGPSYDFKTILAKGLTNQLGNLAHTLSNRFNYYIIGASAWLGVYANSTSLIESIWIISGAAAPIVLSHMANDPGKEKNAELVLFIAKLSFFVSLLCVCLLYLFPNELFIWLLGEEFASTKKLMLYLSPGVLAISFSSILSHYFSGLGQQKVQLLANSSGLLCTLLLSYPLIRMYHLQGACLTATIAYCVQAMVLMVFYLNSTKLNISNLWRFRP